ncbi:TPA: hypothetical protein TT574_001871 [Streptococcus equi subsp. zooepidemicus]|nr:hypothetical protein [Streptococcus equi subsp. zooepidemicus]HEL0573138.1 hypothetical protein [Streptococcus equi subsp. zooepidemicus]HEL0809705.1 hypothetical protein [Streptococcus equi subsp. zooepidemicus]HEL1133523.1 hypothetical protein [Streptococcus equi subsp. zooepidemicus]
MTENYLPTKESIGYKNIEDILYKVFLINLDSISIREGEDENFAFDFTYGNIEINVVVSATGKSGQFNVGEGGMISVFLPNPNYPISSFLPKQSLESITGDEHFKFKIRHLFGRRQADVEYAMRVLKDYLDSDEAKVLLKND